MDDIELPPLGYSPRIAELFKDYARAAVLADRKRREKPERVVHRRTLDFSRFGSFVIGNAAGFQPSGWYRITLCWTDDGRVWIESEKNRELARRLREGVYNEFRLREAADALDGGNA